MTFLEAVKLSAETGCEVRPVGTALRYKVFDEYLEVWLTGYGWDGHTLTVPEILGPWERVEGE